MLLIEVILVSKWIIGNVIINSGMVFGILGGYLFLSKLVLENGEYWSKLFFIMVILMFIVGIFFYIILKEKVICFGEEVV